MTTSRKIKPIVVEITKNHDGFWASTNDPVAFTNGENLKELKSNIVEAVNDLLEDSNENQITEEDLELYFDLVSMINLERLNLAYISEKTGINHSLLRQYASGNKKPSAKRLKEIEAAVQDWGKEIANAHLIS